MHTHTLALIPGLRHVRPTDCLSARLCTDSHYWTDQGGFWGNAVPSKCVTIMTVEKSKRTVRLYLSLIKKAFWCSFKNSSRTKAKWSSFSKVTTGLCNSTARTNTPKTQCVNVLSGRQNSASHWATHCICVEVVSSCCFVLIWAIFTFNHCHSFSCSALWKTVTGGERDVKFPQ